MKGTPIFANEQYAFDRLNPRPVADALGLLRPNQ